MFASPILGINSAKGQNATHAQVHPLWKLSSSISFTEKRSTFTKKRIRKDTRFTRLVKKIVMGKAKWLS